MNPCTERRHLYNKITTRPTIQGGYAHCISCSVDEICLRIVMHVTVRACFAVREFLTRQYLLTCASNRAVDIAQLLSQQNNVVGPALTSFTMPSLFEMRVKPSVRRCISLGNVPKGEMGSLFRLLGLVRARQRLSAPQEENRRPHFYEEACFYNAGPPH
jgi:hypothetical protein